MHNERDAGDVVLLKAALQKIAGVIKPYSFNISGVDIGGVAADALKAATRPPAPEDAGTVERVAKAIDGVQLWMRFNDWTSDRVEGSPLEICRYGKEGEDEIIIVERHPAQGEREGETLLRAAISKERARAALAAISRLDGEKGA